MAGPTPAGDGSCTMPGPTASDHEVTRYLLRLQERDKHRDMKFNQQNDQIRRTFNSQAASIAVAYLVEVFFKRTFGHMLFGTFEWTNSQTLQVYCLWFALSYLHLPLSRIYLKNVSVTGSRRNSFWEDWLVLWRLANTTMVMWAFKDIVNALNSQLMWTWKGCDDPGRPYPCTTSYPNDPSDYWYNKYTDGDDVGWTLKFLVVNIGVVGIALTAAVALCTIQQLFINCNGGKFNTGYATEILKAPPFLLGIGRAQAEIFTYLWYWFPEAAVHRNVNSGIYATTIRIVTSGLATYACISGVRYNHNRKKRAALAEKTKWDDPKHTIRKVTLSWLADMAVDFFFRSLPFAFAWQYTQLFYEAYFHCIFGCVWPFRDCNNSTLLLWFAYALIYTIMANILVPSLRYSSFMLERLDGFYVRALIGEDKQTLRLSATFDELLISLFGIGAGWAYTEVVAQECYTGLTLTCPDEVNLEKTLLYILNVFVFLALIAAAYHIMQSALRLRARAIKVEAIEAGDSKLIFKEIDQDSDGMVSKDELAQFLYLSGLDPQIFEEAFVNLDRTDGAEDGLVSTAELVTEFNHVVALRKADPSWFGHEPVASTVNPVRKMQELDVEAGSKVDNQPPSTASDRKFTAGPAAGRLTKMFSNPTGAARNTTNQRRGVPNQDEPYPDSNKDDGHSKDSTTPTI